MLLLLFTLDNNRYGLEARQVIEVVPLAELKPLPRAPDYVAGVLNYRGAPVPVLDLTQMNQSYPSRTCMSTRIILVSYSAHGDASQLLGLMAERVTETALKNPEDFMPTGIHTPDAAYCGPVANDTQGMLQLVRVEHLLSPSVHALLFAPAAA